ncbi:hypothetical protein AB834_01480 [PVC group bacterium (ex Bugula neritina AB1)]|nr:hypothetical protein AB834_01480 [PVC group bacterium (ex Bugula neritina AB1)]
MKSKKILNITSLLTLPHTFILFLLLFAGCVDESQQELHYGVNDRAQVLYQKNLRKIKNLTKTVHQKTRAHLLLITQKASNEDARGAIGLLKRYQKAHPKIVDIAIFLWHHDHSTAEIIVSKDLNINVGGPDKKRILDEFYKNLKKGLNDSLYKSMFDLGNLVLNKYNESFKPVDKDQTAISNTFNNTENLSDKNNLVSQVKNENENKKESPSNKPIK